jgi:1-acyl-sn-glycerol-3-phosphate acyltransferase
MLYRVSRRVVLTVFWLLWRPAIEGRERIPAAGPLIVASNHMSFIDSIVIPLAVPRKVVFLAKAEYWDGRSPATWPRRLFFAAFEAVPVQREQQQDAQASLDLARGVVERGDAFGIYPEGTRSRDGRLYRGRTGLVRLAAASGAPVIPCATVGVFELAPAGHRFPRPGRVTLRFAPAMDWPDEHGVLPSREVLRARTDELIAVIGRLSGQEYTGVDAEVRRRD